MVIATGSAAALAVVLSSCAMFAAPAAPVATPVVGASTTAAEPYTAPSPDVVAGLPEARYDAVIAALIPVVPTGSAAQPSTTSQQASATPVSGSTVSASSTPSLGSTPSASYHIAADSPLYGSDRSTPVARLAATNFLGDPTVVVPVEIDGDWALVLTPSRQALPSASNGSAPAQTEAWMRTSLLTKDADLTSRVEIAVAAQTLTITTPGHPDQTFAVGVGAPDTPTPTNVTGYIQARYLDPSQGESVYPIQLTSLHSAAADEPFGGSDGGLIGVHFEDVNTGQVSHGCVRLPADAITAVNALPLGTLVSITP